MKRYLLLLAVFSFALVFEAKEVSYDEALTTASEDSSEVNGTSRVAEIIRPIIKIESQTIEIQVDKPSDIVIYNSNGMLIYSVQAATQASFHVGQAGVYFVRVGNEPYKILVK